MKVPPWPPANFWERPDRKFTLDDLKPFALNNAMLHSTLAMIESGSSTEQALICALGYLSVQYARLHDLAMVSMASPSDSDPVKPKPEQKP